jgi:photosystem II stability/assembly factor-like uncharacterized protein
MIASALTLLLLSAGDSPFDESAFAGLGARNIGSAAMSGRISALAVARQKDGRLRIYVGSASGGVWRSDDSGTQFRPIFDDQPVQSIGALAVDPKNPDVLWVGTGESWVRNSVSYGDGLYKTTDGGETWTKLAIPAASERIAAILLDPKNTEVAYVCVPGRLFSDSEERGLYKTTDGGKNFSLILKGFNKSTGCASVALDPKNSDVVYASLWDFRRQAWTFRSGGAGPTAPSGSGLFKSTNAGKTFAELTENGLPPKPWGRIALAVAPSRNQRVYAFVEYEKSAMFVSDDSGKTFVRGDDGPNMVWRSFYFAHLIVDPTNPERVYKTSGPLLASEDACKSFGYASNGIHGDVHAVWIDPANSNEMVLGDDGGLFFSHDRGNHWWKGSNLPISQFYHVSVDNSVPYHVYGGLQDNSSWMGDSAFPGGITNGRWLNVFGGDGFATHEDPADSNFIYAEYQGGHVARVNKRTHESRDIQPRPLKGEKLRFHWNTPMALSPHEKGALYLGSQFLFRTKDHGQTWQRISPDLSTNDPNKQKQEESGGITVDNSSAEMHTVITAIAESPKAKGVIWAGTDDGNLQVTRDDGKTWTNVISALPGLPPNSWVTTIELGHQSADVVMVTFDRHMFGDFSPYVYRTEDAGKTWRRFDTKGVDGYAHVIREDLAQARILYLGTELGLFISLDTGAHWARFTGGHFPHVAVRDVVVHPRDNDLVIGTHGRGIWILDDLTPLRALSADIAAKDIAIVEARRTTQALSMVGGWVEGSATFVGDNPPEEAVITYWQSKRHIFGPFKIEVLDAKGALIETLSGSKRRGLNRVMWSMRLPAPRASKGATMAWEAAQGPRVLPGTYTVRITRGSTVVEKPIEVASDPNASASKADLQARQVVIDQVFSLLEDMAFFTSRIERAKAAVSQHKAASQAIDAFLTEVEVLRKKVVASKEGGAITGEERLREFAASLYGALAGFEGPPTEEQRRYVTSLRAEFTDLETEFKKLSGARLDAVNASLGAEKLPAVALLDRATWDRETKRQPGGKSVTPQQYREHQRNGFRMEPDESSIEDDER